MGADVAERNYSKATEAALWMLSQGRCYKPGCREAALTWGPHADPTKELEIAHICALNAAGPRYDPGMTDSERNEFPNLLMLCRPHHKRIDEDPAAYPAATLRVWKAQRETTAQGRLDGLRYATKEDLEGLFEETGAMLREVGAAFPELAELLRESLGQRHLDRETADLINLAAGRMQLPDYVPVLSGAAASLQLPDHVSTLSEAARNLMLPDTAPQLADAARSLSATSGKLMEVATAAKTLAGLEGKMDAFIAAADQVQDTSRSLETSVSLAKTPSPHTTRSDAYTPPPSAPPPAGAALSRMAAIGAPGSRRLLMQSFGWGVFVGIVLVILVMSYGT